MNETKSFWIHCWRDSDGNVVACAIEDEFCDCQIEVSGEPPSALPLEQRLIYSHQLQSNKTPAISQLVFTDDGLYFDGIFVGQEDFGEWEVSNTLSEWCL